MRRQNFSQLKINILRQCGFYVLLLKGLNFAKTKRSPLLINGAPTSGTSSLDLRLNLNPISLAEMGFFYGLLKGNSR